MKRMFIVLAIVAFALMMGTPRSAMAEAAEKPEYTNTQIKKMARKAHTLEQYAILADYYAAQQRMYERKAVEQMHLWRERAEMPTPLSEKWPRAVDSARNLHDYYEYKAAQAAALFARYDRLADAAAAN